MIRASSPEGKRVSVDICRFDSSGNSIPGTRIRREPPRRVHLHAKRTRRKEKIQHTKMQKQTEEQKMPSVVLLSNNLHFCIINDSKCVIDSIIFYYNDCNNFYII